MPDIVDAGGLKPNTWQQFERLGSAWEQAKRGIGESVVSISRRFGIHRMTVWTHTKDLPS
ncbi:hypothetical protein [Actinopolymorpha alba]|uniref:hypothetical protein n=1 Tax=Actinopolymorpha alba TaxID=533267 RepID=UPI0003772455|nr:hypothetical protein [Actinopolymorpha alba]